MAAARPAKSNEPAVRAAASSAVLSELPRACAGKISSARPAMTAVLAVSKMRSST
jgi:hypothetical protein